MMAMDVTLACSNGMLMLLPYKEKGENIREGKHACENSDTRLIDLRPRYIPKRT